MGCDDVKKAMLEYEKAIPRCKELGMDYHEYLDYNFLFVGSPGTGKTTVARLMGKVFHELGVLPTSDFMEKSASDLTTGFVGQAGKATAAMFEAVSLIFFL